MCGQKTASYLLNPCLWLLSMLQALFLWSWHYKTIRNYEKLRAEPISRGHTSITYIIHYPGRKPADLLDGEKLSPNFECYLQVCTPYLRNLRPLGCPRQVQHLARQNEVHIIVDKQPAFIRLEA